MFAFFAFTLSSCGPSENQFSSSSTEPSLSGIRNGETVLQNSLEEFSTALVHSPGIDCSGILVHPSWILTAGHCLKKNTDLNSLQILFGPDFVHPEINSIEDFPVDDKIYHPNFEKDAALRGQIEFGRFDAVLLHLKKPVSTRTPVFISDSSEIPGFLRVAGFGSLSIDSRGLGTNGRVLRKTSIQFAGETSEKSEFVISNRIAGPCVGDSGGPIYTTEQNKITLWGIVSRGPKNRPCDQQVIITNTAYLKSWISEAIAPDLLSNR